MSRDVTTSSLLGVIASSDLQLTVIVITIFQAGLQFLLLPDIMTSCAPSADAEHDAVPTTATARELSTCAYLIDVTDECEKDIKPEVCSPFVTFTFT